ncbi:hypothetical protein ACWDWO_26580 [Actinopolymorpha singaporensis]
MSAPPEGPVSEDPSSPDPTQRMRARLGAVLALASAQLPRSAAPDVRTPTGPTPTDRTPVGGPPTDRMRESPVRETPPTTPAPGAPAAPAPAAPAPAAPAPAAPAPGASAPDRAPRANSPTTPLITAAVGASVRVRASEPNDLGVAERTRLAGLFKRVGAWALGLSAAGMFFAALATLKWVGGENVDVGAVGWAAVGLALVSLTSLVLAYFTVMGFRQIEYEADLGGGQHEVTQQGSSQQGSSQSRPSQGGQDRRTGDGRREDRQPTS